MPTSEQLAAKLHDKLDKRDRDKRPAAKTGYQREDSTWTVVGDAAHDDGPLGDNLIYARRADNVPMVVWAANFSQSNPNTDVELEWSPNGFWQVYGLHAPRATKKLGKQAAATAQPDIRFDQNAKVLMGGINFLPGRLYATSGLTVNVQAFAYLDSNGDDALWEPSDTNALLLVQAAASGGNDQRAYVRLWFDNTAGAPALGQTLGTAILADLDLTTADADAIATPAGMAALWDINLATADTTLPPYSVSAPYTWIDRRKFVTGGDSGGSVADATTAIPGIVLIDRSVVSGSPIALTAGQVRDANGVAMLGGDRRVPSFELLPGPVVSVSETSRWVRYGVTMAASVAWEQSVLQEPNVFYEDGLWTMFYTGGYANPALGRATSTDGLTWTKYASNPILGQGVGGVAGFVAHTGVIKHADTWYIYFSNGTSSPDLAYATSPDGITWTYQGIAIAHNQVAWSDNWFNSTIWIEDGNQWKMLVEGKASGGGSVYFITLATSTDGISWTFPTGGPLTTLQVFAGGGYSGPMMPVPQRVGGLYVLWYHAVNGAGLLPTNLYRATSPDLITWTQYPHNPLLTPSGVSPEIDQCADPDVHEVNGLSYLYYEGFDNVTPLAGIKLLTFAGPLGALVQELGLVAYLDANNRLPAANLPTSGIMTATAPISVTANNITHDASGVVAGTYTNPTVTFDAKGHATSAGDGISGGSHVHGLVRWTGDGAATVFDLPDIAEYLELVSNAGSIVDPALITLSADGTQVTFSAAPTAANVLQAEYVIASI